MHSMNPVCLIMGRRCGTSTLTKALIDMGYNLMGPLDLRPYRTQDYKPHYENLTARAFDKKILKHFNMNTREPGIVPFIPLENLAEWINAHP